MTPDADGDMALAPARYRAPYGPYTSAADRLWTRRVGEAPQALGPYAKRIQREVAGMTRREQMAEPVCIGPVLDYDHARALEAIAAYKPWMAEAWDAHITHGWDWARVATETGRADSSCQEAISQCRAFLLEIGMRLPPDDRRKKRA